MAPLPISNSQIDKLSQRLRRADQISDEDFDLLLTVLRVYQAALEETQERLRAIDLYATTRTKTTSVLIDKLRREHTSIKSVQDIAGARIVIDGTRDDQDEVVDAIRQEFSKDEAPVKVKDRRTEPSHGYRAVHVIVRVQGLPVEIQVRTVPQDMWAQITEKLGDRWGRGIRYGEPPPDPDKIVVGDKYSRVDLWETVRSLSEQIDKAELLRQKLNAVERNEELLLQRGVATEEEESARYARMQDIQDLKAGRLLAEEELRETLATFDHWAGTAGE